MPDGYSQDESELLLAVGRSLVAAEQGVAPESDQTLIERAERWITAQTDRLRSTICGSAHVVKFAKDNSTAELVGAIAALLESCFHNISTLPLAILLVKRGVHKLCEVDWEKQPPK